MENTEIAKPKPVIDPTSPPAVEPAAPAAPQAEQGAEPAEPAETPPSATGLPETLLRIPAIQGLVAGAPGAISAPIKEFSHRGEAKTISENKAILQKAGMQFYLALDGKTGVVFNSLYIHGDDIKAADQAGQLLKVAPPFDMVNHQLATAGAAHPALNHPGVPGAPKAATIPVPPQSSQGGTQPIQGGPAPAPAPAAAQPNLPAPSGAAQRDLMAARIRQMSPGSPTSGGSPGAGRLLNAVLKPVI